LHGVDGTALLIGSGAGFGIGGYLLPQLGFIGSSLAAPFLAGAAAAFAGLAALASLAAGLAAAAFGFPSASIY
jgi:hypothetical protein